MDIHRSRFVPYPPSAINALAFSHTESDTTNKDPDSLRLAVGRANGNIEIWNPAKGSWLQERVFYGGKDRSVEGLAWTQEPDERGEHNKNVPGRLRLFSIGYSNSVTEWDLTTGLPVRHSSGNHSEVWCFAAQPRSRKSSKDSINGDTKIPQKLIAGCADGTLALLSTEDNDLVFERFVYRATTKKARALSVAYKDRNIVLAGFADSTIRVFDTRNGNSIRNISLGVGPHGGPKEILVWKVKCLPNGDFVSGDSTGDIRIYDGKNYSQTQRISGHEADVLDLAVSRDGTMIFSGGMDRRTCFYTSKKTGSNRGNQSGKWYRASYQRYHDHDVKAMAAYEGHKLSIVVSGGIDTQPIAVPIRQFGKELSRGLPALPSNPSLTSARDARLMVSWWNCELRIWRVKSEDGSEKPRVVARLALQGDENITSVSITQDGGLLAVATASEVKLFQLIQPNPSSEPTLRIRKLEMPVRGGANMVRFTSNGKWLAVITATSDISLFRIVRTGEASDRPRVLDKTQQLRRLPRQSSQQDPLDGPTGRYIRSITHADFSTDSSVFAVVDLAGYIDTWVIEGHEDLTALEVDVDESPGSVSEDEESEDESETPREQVIFSGQRWIRNPSGHLLPRLDSTPALLSFQPVPEGSIRPEPNGNPAVHATRQNPHPHSHDIPDTEHRLLLVSAENQICLFDVLAGRLSEWSRRNPPSSYPSPYRLLDLSAKGCIWDVTTERERLWLYGEKWLFMFNLAKDLPIPDSSEASRIPEENRESVSKKRKRELIQDPTRKHNSGAGDVAPQKEAPVTKMRKFISGEPNGTVDAAWIDVNQRRTTPDSDEEDDYKQQALTSLRRSKAEDGASSGKLANGDGGIEANEDLEMSLGQPRNEESWWHTFKYRPILGMVPVGRDGQALEVALVERPPWDLDLPPRFVGSHE